MSDGQQDDQVEPQQHDRQVEPLSPHVLALLQVVEIIIHLLHIAVAGHFAAAHNRIPYHTSALSGEAWVQELLTGHPKRIRSELGVERSTFIVLLKAVRVLGAMPSRHVSVEEQLSIFLYTVVTGMSCTHVGERFQRSSSTITK
jgi:hypothetical protein